MAQARLPVGGIILCGGLSSRMGRPKAWLPFGGETMLGRVARLLGEAARPLVVVAAPGQEVPPLADEVVVVRDEEEGRGPLQGLVAGLAALSGRADAAFLTGCDVPFLRPAMVSRLIDLLGEQSICVPKVDGYLQPLAALYRLGVIDAARRLLTADRRRLVDLIDEVPSRIVAAAELVDIDPTLQSLRNLNTPEEYEAALRQAGEGGAASVNH